MAKKKTATAKHINKETAEANDPRKQVKASGTMKIKITGPIAGRFSLSANVGETISIEKKQAEEIISSGLAIKG